MCFGTRSLTLKWLYLSQGIDGISASAVFLYVDGTLGGIAGIVLAILGLGYATFPPLHILYGVISRCLAGLGVLFINIAVSTGVAGPAFAIANLCSVLQALGDWGFLGQIPVVVEWIGLVISVVGGIIMSIGDDYVIAKIWPKQREEVA